MVDEGTFAEQDLLLNSVLPSLSHTAPFNVVLTSLTRHHVTLTVNRNESAHMKTYPYDGTHLWG